MTATAAGAALALRHRKTGGLRMQNNPNSDNNYTTFHTYPVSPELRLFIERLAGAQKHRPDQIKEVLDHARSNYHVAQGFLMESDKSNENIRYWTEQCVAETMRAILWLEKGCRPQKEAANRNAEILVQMELAPKELCVWDWTTPCASRESAAERIEAAGRLLKLGYDRLAAKFRKS